MTIVSPSVSACTAISRSLPSTTWSPSQGSLAITRNTVGSEGYLREAETQEIVITRHGKPAGVLFGFETEDDWFDYRLENDPQFFAANRARATVCGQDVELSWRTLKGINAPRAIYTSILAPYN